MSQNQVINYNFYVQNNLSLSLEDLQRAKKEANLNASVPGTSTPTASIFEQKERAKKEFAEKQQSRLAFSPVEGGASTPSLKPRVEEKSQSIYEARQQAPTIQDDNLAEILGYSMIVGAAVFFMTFMFAVFGSSFIEESGHIVFDFVKNDSYYCFLAPLMVPVSIVFLYLHWVSIKFFRHS